MARYLLPTSRELVRINPDKLVCVVASGNYSSFYHVDDCIRIAGVSNEEISAFEGGSKIVLMQLGQVEEAIVKHFRKEDQHFIRIGNSLIVNIDFICGIDLEKMQIELSDDATFHICRKASVKALGQIKDYLEKKEDILREEYKKTRK